MDLESVIAKAVSGFVWVGVDVGKKYAFVVIRFADGSFERPWKVRNPSELEFLVGLLARLFQHQRLTVAMESTGTYGDPLRAELTLAGLPVARVSGKASKDHSEAFDGVPSQHDGKDAAVVAELAAFGKSRPWPYRQLSEADAELAYWVGEVDDQQRVENFWTGKLEAHMARHWPELTRLIGLTSVTLLSLLAHYGGPAALVADEEARRRLNQWGRGALKKTTLDEILASAGSTSGAAQDRFDVKAVQKCAAHALAALREVQAAKARLEELGEKNEAIRRMSKAVGTVTACVLWVFLGDPSNYHCGEAYRKAMGLNLKERSSGKYHGQLKITKRGPGIVRRWLYLAALRMVQEAEIKKWYEAKKVRDKGRAKGALVGVMRKLALALYATGARGETFEPRRLFPGKPWKQVESPAAVEV
ncbi:MAG: IS110 family transposase [Bryobacteraceae bacterium]